MRTLLVALTVLVGLNSVARAQEGSPPDAEISPGNAQRPIGEWYGWQTLLADAVGVGTFVAGAHTGSSQMVSLGLGTYALAPPLIHFAHDRPGSGFLSLGLRVLAPIVGVMGGLVAGSSCPQENPRGDEVPPLGDCRVALLGITVVGTMVAAALFDAATARRVPGIVEWKPRRERATSWAPVVSPTASGASIGVVGLF